MNKLTILTASIGRDTIFDTIESIPLHVPHEILVTGDVTEKFRDRIKEVEANRSNLKVTFLPNRLCAGLAKTTLINQSDTEWFMVLDDDDLISHKYLVKLLNFIEDPEIDWVCPKGVLEPSKGDIRFSRVEMIKDFQSVYFEYDKWSPSYESSHLYPTSAAAFRKDLFLREGKMYELSYGDDIVPATNYMMKYPGVFVQNDGIIYRPTDESVSRKKRTVKELKDVVMAISTEIIDSETQIEAELWMQALKNMFQRVRHMNNHG